MKTKFALMALALMAVTATAAIAEDAAPTAPAAEKAEKAAAKKAEHQKMREENFGERKTKILGHLSERAADIQKKQACVQAAATPDALKGCFPKRAERHHGRRGGEGGPEGGPEAN